MRILIDLQACQNASRHRGIGRYAMAMTKALIALDRGHEFIIALSDAFPETIENIREAFADVLPRNAIVIFSVLNRATAADPLSAWRNSAAELARADFIERLSPDVVFLPTLFEGLWDPTIISADAGRSYLTAITIHDFIPLEDSDRYLPSEHDLAAYYRRLGQARQADILFPISHYVADDTMRILGLSPDRVMPIHNGVDPSFQPKELDAEQRAALMARYGISKPYVMCASPLEPRKNLEGLIAGFGSMSPALRNGHQLVLPGKFDDFARRYLRGLAVKEGMDEQAVVLPGYVPDEDLVALYSACSLFAFPSLSEGFGLPILEAMACGAPVVGSTTTSVPEVVGRADLLSDPTDAMSIAQAMERILANPALQEELRIFGLHRATLFTWELAASTMMDKLEALFAARAQKLLPSSGDMVSGGAGAAGRRKIAFVVNDLAIEHRATGTALAFLASLIERADVTLIGAPQKIDSAWVAAHVSTHDYGWLERHGGKFDRIVYLTDMFPRVEVTRLMAMHVGAKVMLDRLISPADSLVASTTILGAAQRLVMAQSGLGGLIDAVDGKNMPADIMQVMSEQLAGQDGYGIGAYDAPIAIERSREAAKAFRHRVGIVSNLHIVAGIATTPQATAALLHQFRASDLASNADFACIILSPGDALREETVEHIFGNITRFSGDLDAIYRGLISASDLLILWGDGDAALARALMADMPEDQLIMVSEESEGQFSAELAARCAGIGRLSTLPQRITHRAGGRAKAALQNRLNSLLAEMPKASAWNDMLLRLPRDVRGIRPDAGDLADLAAAMARNEACRAPAKILIDISVFAGPGGKGKLDRLGRMWLRSLLQRAGPYARAVYTDGDNIIAANRYIAHLAGIGNVDVDDDILLCGPNDKIVAFDIYGGFSQESLRVIKVAQRRGLSAAYIVINDLVIQASKLLPALAGIVVAWLENEEFSLNDDISALWPDDVTNLTAGPSGNIHAQFDRLMQWGGYCHTLISRSATLTRHDSWQGKGTAAVSNIAAVEAARDLWVAQKQAKSTVAQSELQTASDFDHVITGHLLGSYSLAIVNRSIATTLENNYPGRVRYLPVETTPINHTESVPADEKPLMMALSARPASGREEIVISHHYPVLVPENKGRISLAMFFWEESHIPEATIATLANNFDAIISPARTVTNALYDSGLPIPVATIHHPVDVAAYSALAQRARGQSDKKTFLHVSSCFKRKGVDILLAGWAKAFVAADPVRLVIKTFPNPHNDVEQQVAALKMAHPDLAEIVIINREAERDEMPGFYADADVMVLPSRGEGYNLPALEAMAAGIPLIVTGHGGHRGFCGSDCARLLRYQFAKTQSHVGSAHSMWVEPDVEDLAMALQEQMDPDCGPLIEARRQRAIVAAADESDHGAWLRRYNMMVAGLLEPEYKRAANVAWVSTWGVQCGIAQYSSYLIDHFSPDLRNRLTVLSDFRTPAAHGATIKHDAVWPVENVPKVDLILQALVKHDADAVVIQHQDGLLSWEQVGELTHDDRLIGRTVIIILHNTVNMLRAEGDHLKRALEGLGKLSRVLVHNVSDINLLESLGLRDNVGLLPHGAFASDNAPWPRKLTAQDAPVIGCHGFFFRHKGIDRLIRMVAILRQAWPNLRLRLVNARFPDGGHDAYIEECKQLARDLGVADAIEWYQDFLPIEQINTLLATCDLNVLPYEESTDSASGAVRVCLASMVPLVATDVNIFAELGDAVARVANNDPKTMADVIGPLLASAEKRRSIQATMHDWLSAHDWQRVSATLEGMITGLVQQKRLGWDDY